ncbi:Type 11 methyltransferase [uncultured Paludibacter sp.]|uniref:Type 11 methyltransferase n=1 Tax=uncultured Paludibacter sp. TaxID=497635 RepID=A0A653ALK7_9BACT|nr:Type 11 methyltransferase [uncultured Paludibacter sp.]
MNVKAAYNKWAEQYDTNENKTRDLEGVSLKKTLANIGFESCLEIGCGTGKNTEWLISKTTKILAVDLSDEMLAKAQAKVQTEKVEFIQADINNEWSFAHNKQFDLVTFSLVLEHIENLENIFEKLSHVVKNNGYVYLGELHPFKQYNGTKARFETEDGLQIVTCFNHNISDFTNSAKKYGFELVTLDEFFDSNDRTNIPRILTLLLKKIDR